MRRFEDILQACGGDISVQGLRAVGVGYEVSRRLVMRLRELGVVGSSGPYRQRVLVRPLDEVIEAVRGEPVSGRHPRQRGKEKRHCVPIQDEMRLVHDPGELFSPGATFPADQVLPRKWASDEVGQWHEGTRFARYRAGQRVGEYVWDGERVVAVDNRR